MKHTLTAFAALALVGVALALPAGKRSAPIPAGFDGQLFADANPCADDSCFYASGGQLYWCEDHGALDLTDYIPDAAEKARRALKSKRAAYSNDKVVEMLQEVCAYLCSKYGHAEVEAACPKLCEMNNACR